jgi:hypothetical protein
MNIHPIPAIARASGLRDEPAGPRGATGRQNAASSGRPDALVVAAPLPAAEGQLTGLARRIDRSTAPFALRPGQRDDVVALDDVLALLASPEHGRPSRQTLARRLGAALHLPVPTPLAGGLLGALRGVPRLLTVGPGLLDRLYGTWNALHRAGLAPDTAGPPRRVADGFAVEDAGRAPLETEPVERIELLPGLLWGPKASGLDAADRRRAAALAGMLNTLAHNVGLPPTERARVLYRGVAHTELGSLLEALEATGHTVRARLVQRVALFLPLSVRGPDASELDVAAPIFFRTGVFTDGREAIVPADHSEWVFEVRGPELDAAVAWYQGQGASASFNPVGAVEPRAWVGGLERHAVEGVQAIELARLAGVYGDAIDRWARAERLVHGGYGVAGGCGDSTAVLEQAAFGDTDCYPLLMDADRVGAGLDAQLAALGDRPEAAPLARLREAVRALPNDRRPDPTSARRALASIPWAPGAAPFRSTEEARELLGPARGAVAGLACRLPAGDRRRSDFDLVPGPAGNAVALPQLLDALRHPQHGRAVVEHVAGGAECLLGRATIRRLARGGLGGLDRMLSMLRLSPRQMGASFDLADHAARRGWLPAFPPRDGAATPAALDPDNGVYRPDATLVRRLPAELDLDRFDPESLELVTPRLTELAPGVLAGHAPSRAPLSEQKASAALAELVDRLSENTPGRPAEFAVRLGGRRYTALEPLLRALVEEGHTLRLELEQHAAHATGLFVRGVDGRVAEVPTPILVDTGVRGPDGETARVPALHSALRLRIEGPRLSGAAAWYTGLRGTHFYPVEAFDPPRWLGGTRAPAFEGEAVFDALRDAARIGRALNATAEREAIWLSGYGTLGVCNDAVALVQATNGRPVSVYPLLMDGQRVETALRGRLDEASTPEERTGLLRLLAGLRKLPCDRRAQASAARRALASLPWPAGREPLAVARRARAILSAELEAEP